MIRFCGIDDSVGQRQESHAHGASAGLSKFERITRPTRLALLEKSTDLRRFYTILEN